MNNKFTLLSIIMLAACLGITGCRQVDGNSSTGNYAITGKVTDSEGKGISGVKVTVDAISRSTVTDANGDYYLTGLGKGTFKVSAKVANYVVIAAFENAGEYVAGGTINVGQAAENGVVKAANFHAVEAGSLTIADIQGDSARSPMEGDYVQGITGVVTMISNYAPHWKYNNSTLADEDAPQFYGDDGFYLESLPGSKDLTGKRSNGIFVSTHDSNFESESKWKEGIPTDLQAGDVVTVYGTVKESRHMDHYGSSEDYLTRTEIDASYVYHIQENGVNKTAAYPDGVLITYSQAKADAWMSGHETDGNREYRIMCYDVDSTGPWADYASTPMLAAIDILESMEGMVVRIDNPLVIGSTYYNLTGILADEGKKEDGEYFRTFNSEFCGNLIQLNENTGYQDYNEELLLVDYQATDWNTFYPLTQPGDYLIDSTGERVFRGVMDYTCEGLYMAHPLNHEAANYLTSNADNYVTPYYTRTDSKALTDFDGNTIPDQKWNFDYKDAWYANAEGMTESIITAMNSKGIASTKSSSSKISSIVKPWRTGTTSSSKFDAPSFFTPKWVDTVSPTKGNTDTNSLTLGGFNLENYEAQGGSNGKNADAALIFKNVMLYPDVMALVEMGDDVETTILYYPDDNQYAQKDGHVTAVKNLSDLADNVRSNGGPNYEFRCIDPKEQDFGGKAGVNIRLAIMYNTERVEAVDSGIVTNTYATTHDKTANSDGTYTQKYGSSNLLDQKDWPVQTENDAKPGLVLANTRTEVYKGDDGKVHLTQSPGFILADSFKSSRRPLVQEFKLKGTDKNFFVIACHLGSKRGDYSLYGQLQPVLLLSEAKRDKQAQAVNDFVHEILELDPEAKIVVLGDMNDFAYSTPLKILTGEKGNNQVLWSLTEEYAPVNQRFSYQFQGNLQQIDHVFLSKSLKDKTVTEGKADWKNVCFIPHINSLFNRNNHINFSDHDPDLVKIPGAFDDE